MKILKDELNKYCELHWWNMGKKTLSFKGTLKDLLINQKVTFTVRKTTNEYGFKFKFKNPFGISYETTSCIHEFSLHAKQFIQMELVRMGDKSQLYVERVWRPKVNVNF